MKKCVTLFLIAGGLAFLVSSFGNPARKVLPAGTSSPVSSPTLSMQDSLEKDREKYVALVMETMTCHRGNVKPALNL